MGFKNRATRSAGDHEVQQAFAQTLARLNAESTADVEFAESLFGITLSGPLRSLLSHRVGKHDVELGAWMVHTDAEAYPRARTAFESKPFELVLGESWWIHGLFCDAIPIGRDGGGQIYYARLHHPHEVSLYDPGQGAVRFIAPDLPTFAYLACLGQRAEDLVDELDLDDPEDADSNAPEFRELQRDLKTIADRICLTDDVVATDFDEVLIGLTGLHPSHRPAVIPTEQLHDRAEWLISVLAMGYDSIPLDDIPDTYADEKNSQQWSSPAVRLYWLWYSFLLDETDRLDELILTLEEDPALLVRDSVRIVRKLRDLTDVSAAPKRLQDVLRSRLSLRKLWHQQAVALPPSESAPFAPQDNRRLRFLATGGYSRGRSVYTEEARECVAAIWHSGPTACAPLLAHLDHAPMGGPFHPQYNPAGAALFPYQPDPSAKNSLLAALDFRSADLSHHRLLPGVIRALARLDAKECLAKLLLMLDEFAVVWDAGYAKAGNLEIVQSVCEALAILPTNDAIEPLLDLAIRDLQAHDGFTLRSLAIIALAHTDWVAPAEQLQEWLDGEHRAAALYYMALRGQAVHVDPDLDVTPASCIARMSAAVATGKPLSGVAAAKLALQTLNAEPIETVLAHTMALRLLDTVLPFDEVRPLLRRIVLFARDEDIRHHALMLLRGHEPDFVLTFCDRPTVEAVFEERGEAGLLDLLSAPNPVFAHNVFAKAAETRTLDGVVPFLKPFAEGLSLYRHLTSWSLPYAFESQYYAEISALQAVGEPRATEALQTLWKSGMVGAGRVEYVLKNLSYKGMKKFQAGLAQRNVQLEKVQAIYAAGNYTEACKLAAKLVEQHPSNAPAYRNLGHAYLMSGSYNEAFEAYLQAQRIEPNHAMGWYWVSQASYRKEEWLDVVRCARQGLSIDKDSQRCRFNLALALQHSGQMHEARAEFDRLARENLDREAWMIPDVHLHRAAVLAHVGEVDEASEALRACFVCKPEYVETALEMAELVEALGEAAINDCAMSS